MGYEVKYIYHPKNPDGGYLTDVREEKSVKVGKPFDDTPLEKCAAAILAQLARRDVWVVDVEVYELVKKEVSFKESADGKGIVLKNKRFSFNATAQMVEETEMVPSSVVQHVAKHPHEKIVPPQRNGEADQLYSNPSAISVRRSVDPRSIDRSKKLYYVYFDPGVLYAQQAKNLKLKLSEDTRYAVHAVIPSPTGKIDQQQVAVTDDTGQVIILDEKFFTTAGVGLLGDKELDFSGRSNRQVRRTKLSFEDQMHGDVPDMPDNIPLDTGEIPPDLLEVPDIRK